MDQHEHSHLTQGDAGIFVTKLLAPKQNSIETKDATLTVMSLIKNFDAIFQPKVIF
jgi:hypothetical protein